MADEKIKLPSSSFEQLRKIIIGYGSAKGANSIEEIAKLTTISKFIISKNNPFLLSTNIISGGNKKTITELGGKLARALDHNHSEDIQKYLAQIITTNNFLSNLITTVRIKNGIKNADLSKHILYVSGENDTNENRAGSNAIIDILLLSGLVKEENGLLSVVSDNLSPKPEKVVDSEINPAQKDSVESPMKAETILDKSNITLNNNHVVPTISINIQLQIPETDNPVVYENFFKALKENLLK